MKPLFYQDKTEAGSNKIKSEEQGKARRDRGSNFESNFPPERLVISFKKLWVVDFGCIHRS